MGDKLNCAVEVMPRSLFRLAESITLNLTREAQILLVRVDQVRRLGRVSRTALAIVEKDRWPQCWCRVLEDLLYSIRHMLFRVPVPMVWRVGRVVLSHRLNSAWLGKEEILRQLWWSGMAAERRGLQRGC